MAKTVFIDGKGHVVGRLASIVAKMALEGNKVVVCNCDEMVKTGRKMQIVNDYALRLKKIRGRQKGPFWPKRPDGIVRKAIKRMLPHKKARGAEALERIEVYMGIPKEFKDQKMVSFENAKLHESEIRYITIGELSKKLGATW